MNDNEEERLRHLPLRAPSEALDARIEKLLVAERERGPRGGRHEMPVWKLAAACLVCAALAFAAGAYLRGGGTAAPASTEVRYVIQVAPRPYNVFDWTQYPKKSAPDSILKTRYTSGQDANKS